MPSFTKTSGLFSPSRSLQTRRTKTRAALRLESLERRLHNDHRADWSGSPRLGVQVARVWNDNWQVPRFSGRFLVIIILIGATAVFSSIDIDGGRARSTESLQPADGGPLVEAAVFSPDGRTLAACGWDPVVHIWDVSRLQDERTIQHVDLPHASARYAMAFSPDSQTLAVGGVYSLTVWARDKDEYKVVIEDEGTTVCCLEFSCDGRSLALGGDDHKIRIWDMPSGDERAILDGHAGIVRSVAFSPDGRRLISTGQDRFVMLWDAIRGVPIRQRTEPGLNPLQFAAFSPDSLIIAVGESGGNPPEITLYDAESGVVRTRLNGHPTGISALAFSPDGRTLATAGIDRSIRLWDPATGKERACRTHDVGRVSSLSFSPAGDRLAFAGNDSMVRIWDLNSQRCFRVGSSVTLARK